MTRIESIMARKLDVPMRKAFGIAGGAQELARNVLVELRTNDATGLGEGAPFPAFNGETQDQVLASCAVLDLVGVDLDDTAEIRRRLTGAKPSARCAVESAVVDARARRADVPLHRLFGGATSSLVTDITITTGTAEDAEREARELSAFSTLKIKVGGGDVARDIARVAAVRAARPDATIMLDANAGLSLADALRLDASARPAWFEQPVRSWDDLARFVAATTTPVVLDESITSAADVERAHAIGARGVNIKIMKSGVFEALAIAERAAGLTLMIGGMVETRLAMSVSAAIAAGLGGFTIVDLDTPLFLAEDPFMGGYVYDGERIELAAAPGHGLALR